jgi:hypothetical protein
MNLTVIKALVLLLGGFILLGVGVYFTVSHVQFISSAEQTNGVIIEILSMRTSKGMTLYYPVVRYQPLACEGSVEFTTKIGLWSSLYMQGEEVTVVYHQNNPHDAKIKSFWMLWFLPLVITVFGLMCLFGGWHSWQTRS